MSKAETAGRRKPGEPARRGLKTGPRLPKPQTECSTPDLINDFSREVKTLLRGRKRRREDPAGDDPPKAS